VLNACNIILRFAEILKDRSMQIVQARGKPEAIADLMPFIESIIWVCYFKKISIKLN